MLARRIGRGASERRASMRVWRAVRVAGGLRLASVPAHDRQLASARSTPGASSYWASRRRVLRWWPETATGRRCPVADRELLAGDTPKFETGLASRAAYRIANDREPLRGVDPWYHLVHLGKASTRPDLVAEASLLRIARWLTHRSIGIAMGRVPHSDLRIWESWKCWTQRAYRLMRSAEPAWAARWHWPTQGRGNALVAAHAAASTSAAMAR